MTSCGTTTTRRYERPVDAAVLRKLSTLDLPASGMHLNLRGLGPAEASG